MDRNLSAEAFDEAAGLDPYAAEMAEACMPAIDVDQALQFLELLDPDAEDFVFQTFDDSPKKESGLGKIFYGSLDAMHVYLGRMQGHGAGVFVTINRTKGRSRKIADVEQVRANFADLDGAPLGPVLACNLEPHMIVESSPGKYHGYWIVDGLALDQFTPVQRAIAARFSGDPSVNDLPRVMRLPGFVHQKGEPFMTKITHLSDRMPYTAEQILAEFPPVKVEAKAGGNGHDGQAEAMAELVRQLHNAETFHAALRSLAWRYLGAGMAPGQAVETLRGLMQTIPPWERDDRWQARYDEIPRTVSTAEAKILAQGGAIGVETDPGDEPDLTPGDALYDFSHDGLALDLGRRWVKWARHVRLWNRWLFWSGSQWVVDDKMRHMTLCRDYLRKRADDVVRDAKAGRFLTHEPNREQALKVAEATAKSLRMDPTIASLERTARSNADLDASVAQWDQDTMLLGGDRTIDLRDGSSRYPAPTDYIIKRVACAPSSAPPTLWLSCLDTWTAGDKELQAYLQRMCGYCLTGSIEEEVFFFFYGLGKNGKTKFIEAIKGIMGDYAGTMGSEVLMQSQNERHPTEIARLRGLRLAVASEVEKGRTWAENRIKSLTGGDTLQARFMRQDIFEFTPTFKLVVIGNNKPTLRAVDEAIRRRMHLIPFVVTIPEADRDPRLDAKLKAEWPQILGWMLDGCKEWQRVGLNPPAAVRAATDEYLEGEDSFQQWRSACTIVDPKAWATSGDLFASWREWAGKANEPVGSQRAFSQQLADHGYRAGKYQEQRGYFGLKLRDLAAETYETLQKQGLA